MADRRMFSKRVVGGARFLKMPISCQALYFHLGLDADDDGIVEAYSVMKMVGATEDELRVLVAKGFVKVLNEDLVTYITDWHENNKIRADRKVDSIYKDLLLQVVPDAEITRAKPRADTKKLTGSSAVDVQWTSNGQPMDGIGKDRIGKDSKKKVSKEKNKEKYGEFQNVLLTEDEYKKLKEKFPKDYGDRIDNLSIYMLSKGKQYKNHYATILSWARKEERNKPKPIEPKKYTAYKGEDWERDDFEKAEMPANMKALLGKVGKTI